MTLIDSLLCCIQLRHRFNKDASSCVTLMRWTY